MGLTFEPIEPIDRSVGASKGMSYTLEVEPPVISIQF